MPGGVSEGAGSGGAGVERGDGGGQELLDGGFGFGFVDAGLHELRWVEGKVGQFLVREDVVDLLAGRELHIDGVVEGFGELIEVPGAGVEAVLRGGGGNGRDAVVGRERDPDIAEAAGDVLVEPVEEGVELGVEGVDHLVLVGGVGPELVADDVVGGEADGEQVGDVALAELLALDEGFGEVELVGVGGGRAADEVVELGGVGRGVGFLLGLGDAAAGVEGGGPGGKLRHIEGGSDEVAGGGIDPERAVGGRAGGKDGGAVL